MSKTTQKMIKVSITGFVPAASLLDRGAYPKMVEKLDNLRAFANEQLEDSDFKVKEVNRLVEKAPIEDLEDAEKLNDDEEE